MADGDGKAPEIPIGQVLFENLTKALLNNTNSQIAAAQIYRDLLKEVKLLREDLEGLGGMIDTSNESFATIIRVLDAVAIVGSDRPPTWKDVQGVLQEIKDELAKEAAEEEAEEQAEEEREKQGGPAPIFPRKI